MKRKIHVKDKLIHMKVKEEIKEQNQDKKFV
jgi:hypothetical protein